MKEENFTTIRVSKEHYKMLDDYKFEHRLKCMDKVIEALLKKAV